jgi:hypothetical protein
VESFFKQKLCSSLSRFKSSTHSLSFHFQVKKEKMLRRPAAVVPTAFKCLCATSTAGGKNTLAWAAAAAAMASSATTPGVAGGYAKNSSSFFSKSITTATTTTTVDDRAPHKIH